MARKLPRLPPAGGGVAVWPAVLGRDLLDPDARGGQPVYARATGLWDYQLGRVRPAVEQTAWWWARMVEGANAPPVLHVLVALEDKADDAADPLALKACVEVECPGVVTVEADAVSPKTMPSSSG